jgi:hypothetical protein
MTRILPLAAAALLCCANGALAATPLHRDTTTTGSVSAPTTQPTAAADRFATEAEARSHCRGDTVVWANIKTHVYHFAGNAAYGHTKHGAFMCRADADKTGKFRAAKKEAASATAAAGTSTPPWR